MNIMFEISKIIGAAIEPLVLVVIALLIAAYLYTKNQKKESIIFASAIIITGVLVKLLKEIFHKARPIDALIQETGFSLPSGHSTTSVVFFGFLVYLFVRKKSNKVKWIAYLMTIIIIAIISFTRIYLGVHDYVDILAGIILGGIILTASIIFSKKLS